MRTLQQLVDILQKLFPWGFCQFLVSEKNLRNQVLSGQRPIEGNRETSRTFFVVFQRQKWRLEHSGSYKEEEKQT